MESDSKFVQVFNPVFDIFPHMGNKAPIMGSISAEATQGAVSLTMTAMSYALCAKIKKGSYLTIGSEEGSVKTAAAIGAKEISVDGFTLEESKGIDVLGYVSFGTETDLYQVIDVVKSEGIVTKLILKTGLIKAADAASSIKAYSRDTYRIEELVKNETGVITSVTLNKGLSKTYVSASAVLFGGTSARIQITDLNEDGSPLDIETKNFEAKNEFEKTTQLYSVANAKQKINISYVTADTIQMLVPSMCYKADGTNPSKNVFVLKSNPINTINGAVLRRSLNDKNDKDLWLFAPNVFLIPEKTTLFSKDVITKLPFTFNCSPDENGNDVYFGSNLFNEVA